jgi:hypothetical protein
MALREFVFENLIGDLEYHPKRGVVYLGLGVAALCVWVFEPSDSKFSVIPLVFGVGSLALFLKGIFLSRKTSDGLGNSHQGLGLSQQPVAQLSRPSIPKTFPSIPALTAQIIQDFGTGGVLVAPFLHVANNVTDSRNNIPSLAVFIIGATLFLIGWAIRRLSSSESPQN